MSPFVIVLPVKVMIAGIFEALKKANEDNVRQIEESNITKHRLEKELAEKNHAILELTRTMEKLRQQYKEQSTQLEKMDKYIFMFRFDKVACCTRKNWN